MARNRSHDICYALTKLVNWLVSDVCGVADPAAGGAVARNDYIHRCAAGAQVVAAPAAVAAVIRRYAPVAAVMNDFYWELFTHNRATPYPSTQIEPLAAAIPELAYLAAHVDAAPGR